MEEGMTIGSEARQQSGVTFVIQMSALTRKDLLVFPRKIHVASQFALYAGRFGLFSRYWLRKLGSSPTGSPELASLTCGGRPARFAISSPRSALPPNTLLEATQWFIKTERQVCTQQSQLNRFSVSTEVSYNLRALQIATS